jgi:AcrR family transcriptional regulator
MPPASQVGPVPGTGGPRSEGTRRAILHAARAMFAARGYEQTTIRAVAAQADVDASMVMRYFQSKAGLFTAAISTDLQVPALSSVPAARRGELLVRYFVSRWEEPDGNDKLIALLRTAVTSEGVAEQVQATLSQRLTGPIAALGGEQVPERAALIAAQVLGLALCRYILRFEPLASLPAEDVVAAVGPSVHDYLTREPAIALAGQAACRRHCRRRREPRPAPATLLVCPGASPAREPCCARRASRVSPRKIRRPRAG